MKRLPALVISIALIVSALFVVGVSGETREVPGVYTFVYTVGAEKIETLGGTYSVSVTGSVSLVGETTSSTFRLSTGTIVLPMDVYDIVSHGQYHFSITGYFDKYAINLADQSLPYEKHISVEDGVVYVYAKIGSSASITISVSGDGYNRLVSGSGEAVFSDFVSRGDYTVKVDGSGKLGELVLAYTPLGEYTVAPHGIYKVKVVCIASCGLDGDTIRVKVGDKEEKVRFIGVNTPEIAHNDSPAQCYGNEARDFTDKMLNDRWIYLKFDNEVYDKYHRYLAYVWLTYPELYAPDSGYMYNAVLAREGYARVLSMMPNVSYSWLFNKLQYEARKARKGLWGACTEH